MFTATFSKYIQLLHFLIDQYPQPSDRDVRGGEDCVWNGGSCGVRDGDAHSRVRDSGASNVSFLSAAPSWVLVSYCKNWSASHVFTATYLKYIQLLHVLIGQSFQSSDRDVRDVGTWSVRDGGARGVGRVGGACSVRDGGARGGVRDGEVHGVSFSSATPLLVLALSFCNDWPAPYVFAATFLNFIQLSRVMIGQSFQLSKRDVRDSEDGCCRDGGTCGVRDGGARGGVRDGGSPLLDVLLDVASVALFDVLFGVAMIVLVDVLLDVVLVAVLDVLMDVVLVALLDVLLDVVLVALLDVLLDVVLVALLKYALR